MINQKAFEGAAVRDANLKKTGTVGENRKPKKGDIRDGKRWNGRRWVKIDKVKEAKEKAAKEAQRDKDSRHAYVGNR